MIAMGRMKPTATDAVVALLRQALEDPSESVRQAAVVAIGEIEPGPRLLEPVLGLLRSSDEASEKVGGPRIAASRLKPIDLDTRGSRAVIPTQRFVRGLWRRWVNGEERRYPRGSESVSPKIPRQGCEQKRPIVWECAAILIRRPRLRRPLRRMLMVACGVGRYEAGFSSRGENDSTPQQVRPALCGPSRRCW